MNKQKRSLDLLCLGELLVDLVATATGPLRSAPGFVRAAGGAPANVAVAAARLGVRSGFAGAVGRDEFGQFLANELRSNGVDTRGLHIPDRGRTPLAFVSLKGNAERDFLFYWEDTADFHIRPAHVPARLVRDSRILHFGSISLIHPPMRNVTLAAAEAARRSPGVLVSCDPNLRLNLWRSPAAARRGIFEAIRQADVVKVSGEELEFLTGSQSLERGLALLGRRTDAAVLVTFGRKGAAFRWGGAAGRVPGFKVDAVDSTGAGDGFVAGFLSCLLRSREDLSGLAPDVEELKEWVRYANAVGALSTTRRGAIPAFPAAAEVKRLLSRKA
jgi:fructokinase